jgi:hypothetical protein
VFNESTALLSGISSGASLSTLDCRSRATIQATPIVGQNNRTVRLGAGLPALTLHLCYVHD